MVWALTNMAIMHRMPSFNDVVNVACVVGWVDHSMATLILPGGNPHYGLPPLAGVAGAGAGAAASASAGASASAAAVVPPALNAVANRSRHAKRGGYAGAPHASVY